MKVTNNINVISTKNVEAKKGTVNKETVSNVVILSEKESRLNRLSELKNQIQNGTYKIKSEDLAEKIFVTHFIK